MSDDLAFPDCNLLHDQFVHCLRPTIQIEHIYRTGISQDCGKFVGDWRKCMYAKVLKDETKIKVSMLFLLQKQERLRYKLLQKFFASISNLIFLCCWWFCLGIVQGDEPLSTVIGTEK